MDMNETTSTSRTITSALDTMTITEFSNGIVENLSAPIDRAGGRFCTRERRGAYRQVAGAGTASIDLTVNLSDDGQSCYVLWSANRGRGWGKSHRKTLANEAAAKLFAAAKWETMITWLASVEPVAAAPIDIMRM
jgi:hypothetical protein